MPPKAKKAKLSATLKAPKIDPAVKKAQTARRKIRALLDDLPDDEAEEILTLLDTAEEYERPGATFSWESLPAEVKNLIYHFTFVADGPIKPEVRYPNVPHKRQVEKVQSGCQFPALQQSHLCRSVPYPAWRKHLRDRSSVPRLPGRRSNEEELLSHAQSHRASQEVQRDLVVRTWPVGKARGAHHRWRQVSTQLS